MIMKKEVAMLLSTGLIFCIIHFCYASGLVAMNNCTCEGYSQVYECSITGGGAIVWRGTAFECSSSSNEIVLLQSSSGIQVCNDGAITGHIIRAENSTYVSQLTVSVSAGMIGTNISCYHDSGATQNLIGSSILALTRDPYPPPSNVHLAEINSTHLTFHWSPISSNCDSIQYHITTSNCGICPNVTNSTSVTCYINGLFTNSSRHLYLCTFTVQTVVCDNIVGNESRRIQVTLKTPSAPVISVIPTYSHKTKRLIALTTKFNELEPFNISDGIDGSASSYTITYTDLTTGTACASATVPAASYVNSTCEYKLELPSSSCSDSTEILVHVSGTNRLGTGVLSTPVSVSGVTNQFVDLSFDPASKFATCLFLNQPKLANEMTCSIVYGVPGETCTMFSRQSSRSSSDKVYLGFPEANHLQSREEYCFVATASNGTFTVLVEGSTLTTDTSVPTSKLKFTIGMLPFGMAMGAMIVIIVIITTIFILITMALVRSRRALLVDLERLKVKTIEQSAIYEELDYVHMMSPKPTASSPTIDTGQNTAYLSFSGLLNKQMQF